MLIRHAGDVRSSEITPKALYLGRRQWMAGAGATLAALAVPGGKARAAPGLSITKSIDFSHEKPTSFEAATHYNNFYEYGLNKEQAAERAPGLLKLRPWTVRVDGACDSPGTIDIDALVTQSALEERIYRHRCVEGWSMVIPWVGVPLSSVLKRFKPNRDASFVAFTTLMDPQQMPEQASSYMVYPWPYAEGLRLDEAMHPLTLLAVGLYGDVLPAQNGAPLRLVVPWKYGFKSIKSIVAIRFMDSQPKTFWSTVAPNEYRFFSNVNPEVDNPRWSQATERRIGDFGRRPTLMFNGYGEHVAAMYAGMDLRVNF